MGVIGEEAADQLLGFGGTIKQELDPAPSLTIASGIHLGALFEQLQFFERRNIANANFLLDVGQVGGVVGFLSGIDFKVLGQTFVKPDREIGAGLLDEGMGGFMAQVGLQFGVLIGEDDSWSAVLDEESAAAGDLREIVLHVLGELAIVFH